MVEVIGPLCLWLFGMALIMPGITTGTLALFPKNAGSASALMGSLQMAMGFVGAALCGLSANSTEAMALVPPAVYVIANYKETQVDLMGPGQEVQITVDAYAGHVFHGRVDSIQRGSGAAFSLLPPENATGNYVKVVQRVPLKITFDSEGYWLGPGMSVLPRVKVR